MAYIIKWKNVVNCMKGKGTMLTKAKSENSDGRPSLFTVVVDTNPSFHQQRRLKG